MENLKLHFGQYRQTGWPLDAGVHRLVRNTWGMLDIDSAAQGVLLVQFCVDKRGLWLQVANGARGIHVNGRPVLHMALLRAGDSVYADGVEMLVCSAVAQPVPALMRVHANGNRDDPRVVLRGVGGAWHGRSFPLLSVCEVGSAPGADIHIEGAGHHVRLWRQGEHVLLSDLTPTGGTQVNGVTVREALLSAGDQIVFGPQARFVVEVPWRAWQPQADDAAGADVGEAAQPTSSRLQSSKRWPWLLLAALLLGAALSALLLFGQR
jgi:hypothetical protein